MASGVKAITLASILSTAANVVSSPGIAAAGALNCAERAFERRCSTKPEEQRAILAISPRTSANANGDCPELRVGGRLLDVNLDPQIAFSHAHVGERAWTAAAVSGRRPQALHQYAGQTQR